MSDEGPAGSLFAFVPGEQSDDASPDFRTFGAARFPGDGTTLEVAAETLYTGAIPTLSIGPPTPLPAFADAFPFDSPPRDPARTRICVLHDLTSASDDALALVLKEIWAPRQGTGIDLVAVCVASESVIKRAGGLPSRPRGNSFSRLFTRGSRPPSPAKSAPLPVPSADDSLLLKEAARDLGLDDSDELLSPPTESESLIGEKLSERVKCVVKSANLAHEVPISLVVLPHPSTTLSTLLPFLKRTNPSLVVLASKGHTSGIVDTLVHQGLGKGVLMGWNGAVCLVRMSREEGSGS